MKKGKNCYLFKSHRFRKTVTFLYKLVRGVSPKSYGIHVAHMAGIPIEIIENAASYSGSDNIHSSQLIENQLKYIINFL